MLNKIIKLFIIPVSIVLVAIYSIQPYTSNPVGNTTIWWIVNSLILFAFAYANNIYFDKYQNTETTLIKWYLFWNVFNILRGVFIAENYWDWKGLVSNAMALLIPIVAFTITNEIVFQKILRVYLRFGLPLFLLLASSITTDAYGFYLVPISFLILFYPLLPLNWRFLIFACTFFVLVIDLGARSNVIKFLVPMVFATFYYFKSIFTIRRLEFIRILFFITPFILFVLAVTNVFNIFKIDQYFSGDFEISRKDAKGENQIDNITADTRTFLYVEVLQTADKFNTWWIGRSPARGNETSTFSDIYDITGREERLGNEVAILNIFTWTGIVGVILYFLVFYRASYLAINKSNNFFCKILGLFIAFRWVYSWVEDINYFTLNTFFLWFMIGLAFSKSFRQFTDKGVKNWVFGIFSKQQKKSSLHYIG